MDSQQNGCKKGAEYESEDPFGIVGTKTYSLADANHWPEVNIGIFEKYYKWLQDDGLSVTIIASSYLPAARLFLELNTKPHSLIELAAATEEVSQYLNSIGKGKHQRISYMRGVRRFCSFLKLERGENEPESEKEFDIQKHAKDLPDWLITNLKDYLNLVRRNFEKVHSETHQREIVSRYWSGHLRIWKYLCRECQITQIEDLKPEHVHRFMDHRIEEKIKASSINSDLRGLRGFLLFLQENAQPVSPSLLRIQGLKQPDVLPKYLTDVQIQKIHDELERTIGAATLRHEKLEPVLLRAAFLLMWQAGLRLGEVLELTPKDIDLSAGRLIVRNGKGQKDRPVYLSSAIVTSLEEYFALRRSESSSPLFLYRHKALNKNWLQKHIKAIGESVGVKVHCHLLRHTYATQLLNAGCRITSIQQLLGHTNLNTTMIYARAYDVTIANDYFKAMANLQLEKFDIQESMQMGA